MCDISSIAVFPFESTECFPVLYFDRFLFFFIGQKAVVLACKLNTTEFNGIDLQLF
jgi:hypothetical protein